VVVLRFVRPGFSFLQSTPLSFRDNENTMSSNHIPDGYHAVNPYLLIKDAAAAIEFYKNAFGATELMRFKTPDGTRIMHAEVKIGDTPLMLADESLEMGYRSPKALGGSPVSFMLYVEDADATVARAVAAGAKSLGPVADKDYGRTGGVEDPFGYTWWLTRAPAK